MHSYYIKSASDFLSILQTLQPNMFHLTLWCIIYTEILSFYLELDWVEAAFFGQLHTEKDSAGIPNL